jgi:hypothetical protein
MATKQELEILVKKLKEELRELRKEVKIQSEVELPDKSFCVLKAEKEFVILDLELNLETEDVKIVGKKKFTAVHMANYEAKKRLAYLLNT